MATSRRQLRRSRRVAPRHGSTQIRVHDPAVTTLTDITPPKARVHVRGELDLATRHLLTEPLNRATTAGCRDISLDLGGVTFMDAGTLRAIIELDHRLTGADGTLTVIHASDSVRRWAD